MKHFLNLFLYDTVKYLAVSFLGLFSVIFITENGAVINADIIEKISILLFSCCHFSFNK